MAKVYNKLKGMLFFNMVIRFWIEGYLDFTLSSTLNLLDVIPDHLNLIYIVVILFMD
jgi:hypothetical protein